MRFFKILLIVVFIVTLCLFVGVQVRDRLFTDTTRPVISCESDVLEVSVSADNEALLQGVTARDNVDGDLTGKVMVGSISKLMTADTAKITYVVFDSSSNMGTLTRSIRYTDYSRPRFALTAPLSYTVGKEIKLTGRLHAEDTIDGDLSESIQISAFDVSTSVAGSYFVTVRVMNSLGDMTSLSLPILVEEAGEDVPRITLKEWLVYLKKGEQFNPRAYIAGLRDPAAPGAKVELITTDGAVDTATEGTYNVTYTYRNGNGVRAKAMLTVVVE